MVGRIHEDDIALVRERAHIEDIIGSYVMLKPAGSGALKGLCPFHDEKTPSFQVTPSRGFYYCFGCGEGGDVITFEQKINNLTFVEAVQALADRVGVHLRIIDDGLPQAEPGLRVRILEANQAAAEFYAKQLNSPAALAARQMLDERGFDRQAAEQFGVGFAPTGGRELASHLRRCGFTDAELIKAGLIREGGWDFFQGRVLWPIKDSARSVLGFGARRLFEEDRFPAKYINTPETPVYKKSSVLYGLDLSRQAIGKKSQAVVMEGYTDVMAAHLAGVNTAVAACGTAFGEDHARLLQRLMGNHDAFSGEVIFTFDGDAAGQKAALRVFAIDQRFAAQTYVAVEPGGLDPCDLRIARGDAAVRDLIGRRVPLYRFVMANTVARFDLDRVDGRVQAVRAAAPMINSIRDASKVSGYLRELGGLVGMDLDEVRRIVTEASKTQSRSSRLQRDEQRDSPSEQQGGQSVSVPWPDPHDRNLAVERGVVQLMLQYPTFFDSEWNGLVFEDFSHPAYRAIVEVIYSLDFHPDGWPAAVQEATSDETVRQLEIALLVEQPLKTPDEKYVTAYTSRLQLLSTVTTIRDLKSRLQRMNPVESRDEYDELFTQLLALESQREALQEATFGED